MSETSPRPQAEVNGGTQTLVRGLNVLEALAESTEPVGVGELSRRLGLPKSTTQRLLRTLAQQGWAVTMSDPVTRWRLSPRLMGMLQQAGSSLPLHEAARPVIAELADRTGETVHLSVHDGGLNLVLIDRVDSTQAVRTYLEIGVSTPLYASSGGKAFLAALPPDESAQLLRSARFEQLTPSTITEVDRLLEELALIRHRGYATNLAENREGVCAVGAAVTDQSRYPVAAMAISMPSTRFDASRVPEWGGLVLEAARKVSASTVRVHRAVAPAASAEHEI